MNLRITLVVLVLGLLPAGPPAVRALGTADAAPSSTPGELMLTDDERAFLGSPAGDGASGEELARRTHELTARMRCPVCQGLSIADSPTPAARAMKARVEALLAVGYSEQQILHLFEASYGEFIRLAPKPEGLNLVAWLLPVAALLAAAAWLVLRARRPGSPSEEDLSEYVRRVRREVQR